MDCFYYRKPNESSIQKLKGNFRLLKENETPKNWVISDFLHEKIYVFEPIQTAQSTDFNFSTSKETPYCISKRDYQIEAQALLNAFPMLSVQKAVYSRVKKVPFQLSKAEILFNQLCKDRPNAFVYLVSSPFYGTWVGATPEVLLSQEGARVNTMALAGTHASDHESVWTSKEIQEHEFVVSAIENSLTLASCYEIEKSERFQVSAGPVNHLRTDFTAILEKPNAWKLALELHPTPAVCGTPRKASLELIQSREMHDRSLYAGIIGYFGNNEAQLFVNLRCAQLFEDAAYLYVGGGFTIDSIPDLEWEETEKKAATLMESMRNIT